MSMLLWIIAGCLGAEALVVVGTVGKPSTPTRGSVAVVVLLLRAFMVTVLVLAAVRGVTP